MRSYVSYSNFIIGCILTIAMILSQGCNEKSASTQKPTTSIFTIAEVDGQIVVYKEGVEKPVVTQNADDSHRPYLHPIMAPNSEASLTQYSPSHHKHQTGLYWGFTRVNGTGADKETLKKWFYRKDKTDKIKEQIGRDFFHHPEGSHWQKVSAEILDDVGPQLKWQTIYHMLDEESAPIMEETQTWTFEESDDQYLLSLEWQGKAVEDITLNEFDYGGLFLRMPWKKDVKGEAINAARQRNAQAEGQRAMWVDVGMEIEGLKEWGHMAIFDHPENEGFPQTWRVDGQLGVGPAPARMGDRHVLKGEIITMLHQLVAYTGEHNDIRINDLWADYVGDDGMYNTASLWGIAQQEGLDAKLLSPEEAVAEMTIKEGYKVNAYASEPMITQPMAFCWDDKGRMWIAENRDYESRGHGFSNSGDSRILILEDTDHDGVADKRTVFLENIPFPSAIAVGFDGLYLGAPPNLLFVPDKDQNDKADEEDIKVLLTGWGIRDRHETINSMHWGPDGWLYGLEGFATPSKIRKPQGKGKIYRHREAFPEDLLEADGIDINGGVWRYHPVKDKFEAVAHGFSNPWGIDHDAKGQLFISACVIPHLFHVIPGGIYQRQGGRHFNPYVYKDIQTIVDHRHRSAHGGARIYQSDAFPADQQGRLFMANIHEHAVLSDVLSPNGSGFTASHGEDFMLANNAQWIGFSMEVGPEGGLYVLDWHDADICGKEVLHKETGRVFRIMPEKTNAEQWEGRYDDLTKLSDVTLAQLQTSKSDWHSRRARTILQYRATSKKIDSDAMDFLNKNLISNKSVDHRLKALWSLHVSNSIATDQLIELLNDDEEYIRAWAIQLLCEDQSVEQSVADRFRQISQKEKSAVVRMYLAAALQRIEKKYRWPIAENLASYSEDADDPNIPLLLWYGIEGLIPVDEEKSLQLASNTKLPWIAESIARRLVDADQLESLTIAAGVRSDNLVGMLAGLQGRANIPEPSNWPKTYDKLKTNKKLGPTALLIAQYFGSAAAAKEMLAQLQDASSDISQKKQAIVSLAGQQRPELLEELPRLIDHKELSLDAIRAVASYDHKPLGELLLSKYDSFSQLEKQEAILTLASRPAYGWLLSIALKDDEIPRRDIPAYIALQLRRVVGNGFVEIWGPIDEMSSDKKAQYAKYQRLLSDKAIANADPSAGRSVFQRACGVCHQMFGEGSNLAPDLTGSNRSNTAYLLSNIIMPSEEIQDDYKMVIITTQDGRTHIGNITAETDRQVTLITVGQTEVVINRSDIQSKEISEKSLMPEGILNTMSDQEIINLVAYMKSLEQVPFKKDM